MLENNTQQDNMQYSEQKKQFTSFSLTLQLSTPPESFCVGSSCDEPPVLTFDDREVDHYGMLGESGFEMFKMKAGELFQVIRQEIDPQETVMVKMFSSKYLEKYWEIEHKIQPEDLPNVLEAIYKNERQATRRLLH